MSKAYLILADGHVFEGEGFGAIGETIGELVFNTGVVGYVESLSDPSYYGQIIVHTFPQMGNYGWIEEDMVSAKSHMAGIVVRDWCKEPSNFRAGVTLDAYLKQQGVVGICGIDTREVTQIIREKGVMGAMISHELPGEVPEAVKTFVPAGGVAATGRKTVEVLMPAGDVTCHVAMIDYGAGHDLLQDLLKRGCKVTVFPYDTAAEDILAVEPDGIALSNGPGDPAENTECVLQLQKLLGVKPMFGVCLGHQLLALSAGAKTYKLTYGHRGSNQPAREVSSGKVYITGQNHGYAVEAGDLEALGGKLIYVNANDGSCEGIAWPEKQAFSLQFHPETLSGARKMEYDLDTFVTMMKGGAR